jgi:hypothetical protein
VCCHKHRKMLHIFSLYWYQWCCIFVS